LSDHVPILRHLLLSLVPPTAPPDISTLSLHDALPISLYAERSRPRFRWRTASREIRGFCRCRGSSGTAPWIASSRQRRHSLPKSGRARFDSLAIGPPRKDRWRRESFRADKARRRWAIR